MRIKTGIGILFLSGATAALLAQTSQPSQSTSQPSQSTQTDTSRSSAKAGDQTMKAPMSASDCTSDAWRNYSHPKFKSEKACQSYVQKHMKKGTSGETNAPKPDMSSGTGANSGTNPGANTGTNPRPTPHP
jgi:hypothetical protein